MRIGKLLGGGSGGAWGPESGGVKRLDYPLLRTGDGGMPNGFRAPLRHYWNKIATRITEANHGNETGKPTIKLTYRFKSKC